MSKLKNLFQKKKSNKLPKGFYKLAIEKLSYPTESTILIELAVPKKLQAKFEFIPGQYLNFAVTVDGEQLRRSYSICSGKDENLTVAVKTIPEGKVSHWFFNSLQENDMLFVSPPEGNFQLTKEANVVGIAAGSGITPIASIAKEINKGSEKSMSLFYANKTEKEILFQEELEQLENISVTHFLTQEKKDGYKNGRITKESFTACLKENLELLKADAFYICGPEEMIFGVKEALELFGVSADKIRYELFTTPTLLKGSENTGSENNFEGESQVTVIIDDEEFEYSLHSDGKTILEKTTDEGADPPYSCRGGVCSTCKAKIIKGKASMELNYALTDKEVEEGYILSCQAHPASEELIVNYDE